jgi:uncharacterized protein (TIGR02145 family)
MNLNIHLSKIFKVKYVFIYLFLLFNLSLVHSQIRIGDQVWQKENLNTVCFRNGDSLLHAQSSEEWEKANENRVPAWCFYEDANGIDSLKGRYYNGFAVFDSRGLAPFGSRIPSQLDFIQLWNHLNTIDDACLILKSSNGWTKSQGGTGELGFDFYPFGLRSEYGSFRELGASGKFWTCTEKDSDAPDKLIWNFVIDVFNSCGVSYDSGSRGLPIRCIDETSLVNDLAHEFVVCFAELDSSRSKAPQLDDSRDDDKLETIQLVNGHVWMKRNLASKTFANGDSIYESRSMRDWIVACRNGIPSFCSYEFKDENSKIYGYLYNSAALRDIRGLAPDLWRVPNSSDFDTLAFHTKDEENAGFHLKNTYGWNGEKYGNGINSLGFEAMPGGKMFVYEDDFMISTPGTNGQWWSINNQVGGNFNEVSLRVYVMSYDSCHFGYYDPYQDEEYIGASIRLIRP